ncbi:GAST1 protein precursor, putative [Ricinus communis]|uniref:GAST1 protein, putative n=1 Tax=Ricinus communis TaxID=3988 RepID=B9RY62_RICCO|nr:GAST1 protein precursor, putative [Ricinus communis]|eukprot:XP_002518646.1 snakin-1 [Ricinus communis]
MKFFFATLLLCFFLLSSSFLVPVMAKSLFCANKCNDRCARAGVKDRCIKYCEICCAECKCVPSGTYGNKLECPCYRDKKNSKGKSKCP